jgi:hypothetical protein
MKNNYIELGESGKIDGISVQCHEVDLTIFIKSRRKYICDYYDCAFNNNCEGKDIPCGSFAREDNKSVYFKKL